MKEKATFHATLLLLFLPILLCAFPSGASEREDDAPLVVSTLQVGMQYAAGFGVLDFVAEAPLRLHAGQADHDLAPGAWKIQIANGLPARQRFHVFAKTFAPVDRPACDQYLAEWKAVGFAPEILVFGRLLQVAGGRVVDNRRLWVSVARCETEAEAETVRKRLEDQEVWAWVRPETIAPGSGTVQVSPAGGGATLQFPAPVSIECDKPIAVRGVDRGFWREMRGDFSYVAPLRLEVGPDGLLELRGGLPIETYLAGVLPAEMPSSWPAAALQAQAVAARSEVLANLAGKHLLEGFDFCAREHCRAFLSLDGHTPATDAALDATRGEVLVRAGQIVPTVYSANCGGWTENNENVWSGPADPVLRGVPDFAGTAVAPDRLGLWKWIAEPPRAYCADDAKYFRWSRRFSVSEMSTLVNQRYPVGRVREIRTGIRGESGRLVSVAVAGDKGSETIRKELPIRQTFGGLPSAMFVVSTEGAATAPSAFVFHGGGFGHGVGLCQQGARGMAARGIGRHDILKHYFSDVTIERLL